MVDRIKPLKIETASDGTQVDYIPTESNPTQDYIASKGVAFENENGVLIDCANGTKEIQYKDPIQTTYLKLNDIARYATSARFAISAGFDGTASTGRYLEFNANVDSNLSGFVAPRTAKIKELSITNNSTATATVKIQRQAPTSALLYTATLTAQKSKTITGLDIDLSANDDINIQIGSGSLSRPIVYLFLEFT